MDIPFSLVVLARFRALTLWALVLSFLVSGLPSTTLAGNRLLIEDEVTTISRRLEGELPDEVRQKVTTYLNVIKKMNQLASKVEISENLKKRIFAASGYFENDEDALFTVFDTIENHKNIWKSEVEGSKSFTVHPVELGSKHVDVYALDGGHLCVGTEENLGEGEASTTRSGFLYRNWKPVAIISSETGPCERTKRERRVLELLMSETRHSEPPMGLPRVHAVGSQVRRIWSYRAPGLAVSHVEGSEVKILKLYQQDGFHGFFDEPNPLDQGQKRRFFLQTTLGMAWLHSHDIVHKDLKPENLLFNDEEAVYVDFDLVEFPSEEIHAHKERRDSGSLGYAAPEIMRKMSWQGQDYHQQVVNAKKADVFSHSFTWALAFYFTGNNDELARGLSNYYHSNQPGHINLDRNEEYLVDIAEMLREREDDPIAHLLARGLTVDVESRISSDEFVEEALRILKSQFN